MINQSILEKAKLGIVKKIFPVKKTQILLLDHLEIALKEAKVNHINIPPIQETKISADICLQLPAIEEENLALSYYQIITCKTNSCAQKLRIHFNQALIGKKIKVVCSNCKYDFYHEIDENDITEDYTPFIKGQLFTPDIEMFPMLAVQPKSAGKSFKKPEPAESQISLFDLDDNDDACIHGLSRRTCAYCIEKERAETERSAVSIDLFDLILPILQPPLGDNFDNIIAFPPGMSLYPFQRSGVKFLADNKTALLGDEMGLGKSIQAIVALKLLYRTGQVTNGLILCPKSVLTDWEKKFWNWAPELRVMKVHGHKTQRHISWNTPSHIYLTTYETLRQDLAETIDDEDSYNENEKMYKGDNSDHQDGNFDQKNTSDIIEKKAFSFVILDEIQRIKNPGAMVTKAVRKIHTPIRWGLSGTPLENRVEELISIFAFLKPGLLRYDDAVRPGKIKNSIKQYFLRRRKSDVLPELPAKVEEKVFLDLLPSQKEAYVKAEHAGVVALNEKGDTVTVQHILALITKLKQICNYDHLTQESCKLEYLLNSLEEIVEQDDKALVFSQYPEKTLASIKPSLEAYNPVIYDGSLSNARRERIVDDFQNKDNIKVLLMSVRAGGVGITLTRASYVFHFDLWWNPAVAAQAEDRAHRIGQKKTVFVTSLLTAGTIEERINNLLNKKRELFNEVIDDLSDTNLSRVLTEDELFGLFNIKKSSNPKPMNNSKTSKDLDRLSPREFENIVASLYHKMGYAVKLTPQSNDKGIDIFARRVTESGTEILAIQCKHYIGAVGVEHARSLYGVIQAEPSITKGLLITSGTFSRECQIFAQGKRIELFNGNYLRGLMEKYNIGY